MLVNAIYFYFYGVITHFISRYLINSTELLFKLFLGTSFALAFVSSITSWVIFELKFTATGYIPTVRSNSRKACARCGSVLASVNSAEENESFWQFMQDNNYCKAVKNIFIGVHKDNGIFKNIDGSPLV